MDLSVVIPTYKLHHPFLRQAVESIDFQGKFEVIIVNDSPDVPLEPFNWRAPITVINRTSDTPKWGAGEGRNRGADAAQANVLLWLDSDDKLIFGAVNRMWYQYQKLLTETGKPHIIYGDLIHGATGQVYKTRPPYTGNDLAAAPINPYKSVRPYLNLMPRKYHVAVNGYPDEQTIDTYEELVYEADQWVLNLPQHHMDIVTYDYRWWPDSRRALGSKPNTEGAQIIRPDIIEFFNNRYKECYETMACGTCGNKPKIVNTNTYAAPQQRVLPTAAPDETQLLTYTGARETRRIEGPATQIAYKFGRGRRLSAKKIVDKVPQDVDPRTEVHIEDARILYATQYMNSNEFNERRVVQVDRKPEPPVKVEPKPTPKPEPERVVQVDRKPEPPVKVETSGLKPPMSLVVEWTVDAIVDFLPELNIFDIQQLKSFENAKPKPRVTLLRELDKSLGVDEVEIDAAID